MEAWQVKALIATSTLLVVLMIVIGLVKVRKRWTAEKGLICYLALCFCQIPMIWGVFGVLAGESFWRSALLPTEFVLRVTLKALPVLLKAL